MSWGGWEEGNKKLRGERWEGAIVPSEGGGSGACAIPNAEKAELTRDLCTRKAGSEHVPQENFGFF